MPIPSMPIPHPRHPRAFIPHGVRRAGIPAGRLRALTIPLLLLLISAATPPVVHAESTTRTIRVAALDIADSHDTLWLRTGAGEDPLRIPLNTRVFSQPIQFESPATVRFYSSAEAAAADEPPAPVASVQLANPSSLLVLAPRQDRAGYEAYAIADHDFPFGSFRLVNFSRAKVQGEFSEQTVTLDPGGAETVDFRGSQNAITVRIHALAGEPPPRLIRQTSWSIIPTQRELVLFFPNPDTGLVRLRHFVDTHVNNPGE